MILPPALRAGARVSLVAPAGPVSADRIAAAVERCHQLGLVPVLGASASVQDGFLAGSDEQRRSDLQGAIDDPDIDAIWTLRGGYGTMRLLPLLDFRGLRERPRAYIGFSDHTAVHLALGSLGIASVHGPHAGGDASDLTLRCLHKVLWRPEAAGQLEMPDSPQPVSLVDGIAEGPLVGGNLSLLAAMAGTATPLRARDAILFIEEIGELPYRIDRLWTQLTLSGALDGVAGLAFGQFTNCSDDDLGQLRGFADALGVPAVARLPFGHESDNWTLPLGIRARLDARRGSLHLLEAAVTP